MGKIQVPVRLLIAAVVTLVVGLVLQPIIAGLPEDVLVRNTIIAGIPFILIFVAIILFFIAFVWVLSSALSHNVPRRIYKPVENILIAGIVLGVIGMFQPWLHIAYRIGFHVLLVATIAFIIWSHIVPRGKHDPELTTRSTKEIEQEANA